jgi:hypothetical protein
MNTKQLTILSLTFLALGLAIPAGAVGQLGRQQGLVEPNVAQDEALLALPALNAAAVEAIKESRPILSATDLDALLASRGLSPTQRSELYRRMFVHVDLNRGSDAELLLIPGMTPEAVSEIKAGRPWSNFGQFSAALGRTRSTEEVQRLEQYLFIPIELNTWTEPIMDSFASIGVGTSRWKREFEEYRPWTSMAQFEREIGKYVRGNPAELTRLQRYVIINP